MSDTLATFRTSAGNVRKMLTETALSDLHDDIYLRIHDDRVETIMASNGNSVVSNCTYHESYFDEIEVEADDEVGAILNVERVTDYLSIADAGGTIVVSFLDDVGTGDDILANDLRVEGGLNTQIQIPTAQDLLDRIPDELPDRFDEDNRFHSSNDGGTHTTFINTSVSALSSIEEAVELDSEVNFYPITVEDEEFTLEIGKDGDEYDRTAVWGSLGETEVEGEDVDNFYNTGFTEVVDTLKDEVEIQVSDGGPMTVVQEGSDRVVRHVIAPTNVE